MTTTNNNTQMNDDDKLITLIPTIVTDDPRITIDHIRDILKTDHGIKTENGNIESAIESITENGIRSFANCPDVKRDHGDHLNRFMLIETKFRKIKSCRRVINAGNGAKYSVTFYAQNGAVCKHWIGVNQSTKQISFGYDHTMLSINTFDDLQNRAQKQSSTVAWILSEFPENGMSMATDLLNTFQFVIDFPTPDHLNTFNGFQCVGERIDGTTIDGSIDAPDHHLPNAEMIGIKSSLFHPWNQFKSITIFAKH